MFWVRIDNRLVHGQIIEAWLPFTKSKSLVVANDELADDDLRKEIMSLAIPDDIARVFLPITELSAFFAEGKGKLEDQDVLLLFADCFDAKRAYDSGVSFLRLNIGNMHYAKGKEQICSHIALGPEEKTCLNFFHKHGVELDYRCVPNQPVQVKETW
jgi:PTS system mannose-specific IIB component